MVLAFAWLALFLYGFPGQMVPDTFEHLMEARAGYYTDASPPVFNVLFAISDWSFGGQVLVFLLQTTAFVAGAYLTFRRLVPARAHWLTLAFVVFPPVITPLALVWKDALLPGLLMLGFASMGDERRWVRLLGLLALFGAISIRYNAFAAAFPIVILLFEWKPGMARVKRYAIAFAAWAAISFAAFQANALLTDRQMHLWYSSLALFDIAGTVKNTSPRIPDAELAKLLEGTGFNNPGGGSTYERVVKMYRPRNFYYLVEAKDPIWNVPITGITPAPLAQREAIGRAWKTIVTEHKGAYLQHRWDVFRQCLAWATKLRAFWPIPKRFYEYPDTARDQGVAVHATMLQHDASAVFTWLSLNTPLFEPFVYFIASLLLLIFARKHRDVLALLLSGIAIELTLFFLASSPDYRYSHWMVLCTLLATITLVARRYRPV
ncbi:MAG: hypothetical protein M4D80_16080 [Myxococcota bacterium]|nr:hypothetical protein [Myxococcota bacterium]